jgi:hypothetical protein
LDAPARLTVPGIRGGVRYRAEDGRVPTWLAYYERTLEALHSPEYATVAVRGQRERRVVAALATLDRRVYELLDDAGEPRAEPAPLVVCVGFTSERPDELAAWYREEHVPLLLEIPGWRRTRRFRRRAGAGPEHLALHEVDDPGVFDSPAYRAATSTPRRDHVLASVTERWRRVFAYHRTVAQGS